MATRRFGHALDRKAYLLYVLIHMKKYSLQNRRIQKVIQAGQRGGVGSSGRSSARPRVRESARGPTAGRGQ